MRLFAVSTFVLVLASSVLASPIDMANASSTDMANSSNLGPSCTHGDTLWGYLYEIQMPRAMKGNVKGLCDLLWKELYEFSECQVMKPNRCGAPETDEHQLDMLFHTPGFCKPWMVEKTFWKATGNRWGEVHCHEK